MLRLENIKIQFEDVILENTDLLIPEHCITLIRGVSGSGKTSLLYRLGLVSQDRMFSYIVNGEDLLKKDDRTQSLFRRNHIAYILQDNSLFEQYDVIGNLKLYAGFRGRSYSDEQYRDILRSVRLEIPFTQSVQTLSGGERQRLAIACALCKDTEIILLDEPTCFLDDVNEINLFQILKDTVYKYQKTIIITSHSEYAEMYADQIYEIRDKRLTEIRHYEEQATEIFGKTEEKPDISFYLAYIVYFLRKYIAYKLSVIMMIAFSVLTLNYLSIQNDISTEHIIREYESVSENQMFVTNDSENISADSQLTPFSFCLDSDNAAVYPYIRTVAEFENTIYPILPCFPENHIENKTYMKYRPGSVYISYQCFKKYWESGIDLKDREISVAVQTSATVFQKYPEHFQIAGVLWNYFQSPYLKNTDEYFYMDYSLLDHIYQKTGAYQQNQYGGYTIIADNFDQYKKLAEKLSENYGVKLFFEEISELQRIIQSGNTMRKGIMIVGSFVTFLMLSITEVLYFRKRDKEMMMLKMNGIRTRDMTLLLWLDTLLSCIFAGIFSTIFLIILQSLQHRSWLQYALFTIAFLTAASVLLALVQYISVRKMSVERIIRKYEKI